MPRKSKLTAEEIQAAEMAEDDRKKNRNNGFSLMDIRDRGWARLNNGIIIVWHTDKPLNNGEVRDYIPPGHFALHLDKEKYIFEADDFQKFLRWV